MTYEEFQPFPGSFRDHAGAVLDGEECVYRAINHSFAPVWDAVCASGFFESPAARESIISFREIEPLPGVWKTLASPRLPFISYPYEWCFGQLKTAALHTLDVFDAALEKGLWLRDATAYNIQFQGGKPIFIDLLSFEPRKKSKPWPAYRQFCSFFLGPLALMSKKSSLCGRFLRDWIEGLPLELVSSLLPFSTYLSPSLAMHLHYHARLQKQYEDPRKAAEKVKHLRLSENAAQNLSRALRIAVEGLKLPRSISTEWGDYYNDTNYSQIAADFKKDKIDKIVGGLQGEKNLAVDIGANTARYSSFLADSFKQVLAVDIDYLAIEKLWAHVTENKISNLLPLVMDLCNPSPAIGWDNSERESFQQRCKADYLSALAVIHHLVFSGGIPLPVLAKGFAHLIRPGGTAVIEWVPLEDSQVQRLLASREYVGQEYSLDYFLKSFSIWFNLVEIQPIQDSRRQLAVFHRKEIINDQR